MSPEERAAAREAIAEERSGAGTLRAELLGNGLEMALDALDAADKENEQLREASAHDCFLLREARPYVAAHEPDPQHLTVSITEVLAPRPQNEARRRTETTMPALNWWINRAMQQADEKRELREEMDRLRDYAGLLERGLSAHEAREAVWPGLGGH